MGRAPGVLFASAVLVVTVGGILFSAIAQAKAPSSHVCAADRPTVPVPPPLVAMPGTRTPKAGAVSLEPPHPLPAAEPPSLMMGCLSREYPLTKTRLPFAQTAVSLVEAPQSAAAIYRFDSQAGREALIAQWLLEVETEISPDLVSLPATPTATPTPTPTPTPTSVFIADWQNSRWSYPGKRVVHAMFPENGQSGKLCLVRVDLNGRPEALAALNNWCMDTLDLWAD